MKNVKFIWLIFTILFFCLLVINICFYFNELPAINVKSIKGSNIYRDNIDIIQQFKNFVILFNNIYIKEYNKSIKIQAIVSCFGYFAAFATSLISYFQSKKQLN